MTVPLPKLEVADGVGAGVDTYIPRPGMDSNMGAPGRVHSES